MAVFMFFPLEGYHILATKLFIFVFAAGYLVNRFAIRWVEPITCIAAITLLPVISYAIFKPLALNGR